MTIDSEMLTGGRFDAVVYVESIKAWEPPFDGEAVTQADRDKIVDAIKLRLIGLEVDWQ